MVLKSPEICLRHLSGNPGTVTQHFAVLISVTNWLTVGYSLYCCHLVKCMTMRKLITSCTGKLRLPAVMKRCNSPSRLCDDDDDVFIN